jgi:lysyl-tRNA synthetase class 2
MEEAADLVRRAMASTGRIVTIRATSYRDLFRAGLGIDPLTASEATLFAELDGITIDRAGLTRDDALDVLLTHRLQPHFAEDQLLQLYDYPASQCALARIRDDDPPVAERFELYLGSIELANGYHELADANEQRARFERDNRRREARGQAALPLDERLLAALERGLPECAGVALGVERLLMCMLGTDAIADVLAYPFAEA